MKTHAIKTRKSKIKGIIEFIKQLAIKGAHNYINAMTTSLYPPDSDSIESKTSKDKSDKTRIFYK